jgi:SnoaL-like domain
LRDLDGETREAIRDLVARYNAFGDAGRVDELAELFCDDAVLVVYAREIRGAAAIRALFERVARESGGELSVGHLRHFTATHWIEPTPDGEAFGHCYFQTLTARGLDHWGRYDDRYRRVAGRWRFARREVRVEGQVAGSWAAAMRARLGA